MGYSTDFIGELKFTCEMTEEMMVRLSSYFNEDIRDHPEWRNVPRNRWGSEAFVYIDVCFNGDASGIKWSGSEKTYGMTEIIQFLIDQMQEVYPDFGLVGVLEAQGEDVGDHWFLVADVNTAKTVEVEDYYVNYKNKNVHTSDHIECQIK